MCDSDIFDSGHHKNKCCYEIETSEKLLKSQRVVFRYKSNEMLLYGL